ncbi:MAG: NADP-dependent malic enzyme [Pseudomonadota bacterium]|nr:NADP-dependent malic enzyme [Pseudomonadota bacterium]
MSEAGKRPSFTEQDALKFHSEGRPGKLEIAATKPMVSQRDLSLAYSPGVAVPVLAIADDPAAAYDYTNKGNMVAVVSNGSAILGLGNLGALAAKPVMEGKAVLFKRFADVDGIDILVDTADVDAFVNCVRYLGPSFGDINLEDLRAPDCFVIEERLRELMDIPVFHDDQHGTAIIAAAGLINALHLTGRDIAKAKLVCSGAGAAAIATLDLLCAMGLRKQNVILCDSKGVVFQGRDGINKWKSTYAVKSTLRTLADALKGADIFIGLSAKGAMSKEMVASMAAQPVIFAMANPDPEITPEEVAQVRDDAIMATGRSDYPNQINNVLGFPFIFRGALDVRAREINMAMKIAAAEALAELARLDVPEQVAAAYDGHRPKFGRDYIIPVPFDPRLITHVPAAVVRAAMATGVAQKPIVNMAAYAERLGSRLDPVAVTLSSIIAKVKQSPKRVVFAEGIEPQVVRAARRFLEDGLGTPVLVGREASIRDAFSAAGVRFVDGIEIVDPESSSHLKAYTDFLYARLERKGYLKEECADMARKRRTLFAACMVTSGAADSLVSGVTRNWYAVYEDLLLALDPKPGRLPIGISLAVCRGRTVLVADSAVHDMPDATQLADIAIEAADAAARLGFTPRVAMLAYSTFGYPSGERTERVREAVALLEKRGVNFEFDGDMAADVALNPRMMSMYPFCRLSGPANVLIMPAFHSASISTKMLQELGGATVIGPLLVGLEKPAQIAQAGAGDGALVNLAALAAYDLGS